MKTLKKLLPLGFVSNRLKTKHTYIGRYIIEITIYTWKCDRFQIEEIDVLVNPTHLIF